MRRGFTLMELMIVIIIIGILATLGFAQYTKAVEKSRGAEGKQMLGSLVQMCGAKYMETSNTSDCNDDFIKDMGLPNSTGCSAASHFRFSASGTSPSRTFLATRCTSGGKTNTSGSAKNITVTTNYDTGISTWDSTPEYK